MVASLALVLAVLAAVAYVQVTRPLPRRMLSMAAIAAFRAPALSFTWPSDRESAITVSGIPGTWEDGQQSQVPIASVTKMMTAYIVLHDHPLASASVSGPSITITAADAATYQSDVSQGDSSAAVAAGESLTERQALEALMLPSADNVAAILAVWDAGSISAFTTKMNAQARALGMTDTDYTDPSGLAATTVSTARDQLILVQKAMTVPAFAAIVAMPSAVIPVAGTVHNYNYALGQDGIIGVKTGSDGAAQGCWAFAARHDIGGTERTVYGVVLGAPAPAAGLVQAALNAGLTLANSAPGAFRAVTVLPAGTVVGRIIVPWSKATVPVVTARAITGVVGPGAHVSLRESASSPGGAFASGTQVGEITAVGLAGASSTPLVTQGPSGSPPLLWRLRRL